MSGPPPRPQTAYAWYVVVVLLIISIIAYLDRLVLSFLIEPIKSDLRITDTEAGALTGMAFSVFFVAMGLPIGRLIDTRPRPLVLAACLTLWSAMTMLSGLAGGYASLFLARCGVGAGEAAMNPAAVSIISDTFPPERVARPVSLYTLGMWGGGGLAIILGGQLVSYFTGLGVVVLPGLGPTAAWRLVLLCVGAPGLLAALLVTATLRDPRRRAAANAAVIPTEDLRSFLRREGATFALILAGHVSFGFVSYSILAWYPAMMGRTFHISQSEISLLYGIPYLIAGILGAVCGGPLIRTLQERGHADAPVLTSLICMGGAFLPSVVGPLAGSAALCMACLALTVFFWGINTGAAFTTFVLATPSDKRGFMTSSYVVVMNVTGGAFAAVLVGALADHIFGQAHLGYGISATAAVTVPIAALCFRQARAPYRALLARTRSAADAVGARAA